MNYCNEIQGFINYAISNSRNISGGGIRCPCKRCKNKKNYQFRCCNNAYSTKKVNREIPVLVNIRRTICSS